MGYGFIIFFSLELKTLLQVLIQTGPPQWADSTARGNWLCVISVYVNCYFLQMYVILKLLNAIGAGGLGCRYRAGQIGTVSPTARHRCDVPSELDSPGPKPRR